jgi:hypothetical protein
MLTDDKCITCNMTSAFAFKTVLYFATNCLSNAIQDKSQRYIAKTQFRCWGTLGPLSRQPKSNLRAATLRDTSTDYAYSACDSKLVTCPLTCLLITFYAFFGPHTLNLSLTCAPVDLKQLSSYPPKATSPLQVTVNPKRFPVEGRYSAEMQGQGEAAGVEEGWGDEHRNC